MSPGRLNHAYSRRFGCIALHKRSAVVLVVNEVSQLERCGERLYVRLSRARDQLVVCGDPGFIRDVGGADLARRLNAVPAGLSN